jgi:hypothetical protein
MLGQDEKYKQNFSTPERERSLANFTRGQNDNINVDLKAKKCGYVD